MLWAVVNVGFSHVFFLTTKALHKCCFDFVTLIHHWFYTNRQLWKQECYISFVISWKKTLESQLGWHHLRWYEKWSCQIYTPPISWRKKPALTWCQLAGMGPSEFRFFGSFGRSYLSCARPHSGPTGGWRWSGGELRWWGRRKMYEIHEVISKIPIFSWNDEDGWI